MCRILKIKVLNSGAPGQVPGALLAAVACGRKRGQGCTDFTRPGKTLNQEQCLDNNDILRRIRYIFDLSDTKMMAAFSATGYKVTRAQISDWLKKDDDAAFKACDDKQLAIFLNGFITMMRGQKDGEQPVPESRLNNNLVFRKLKIALNLKDDDVLHLLDRAGFRLSKHELSAFFRKPEHKHYRPCKDQVLRNFLQGLQYEYRGEGAAESTSPAGS